ncbi:hypothetical protein L195_g034504 [Trifolium pratense]|uniref:Uncharacterized protein n=2 Tax=Trifolium pratense TaxID=57577 RepID=A0A2K3LJ21_TRIPR|nr:hypothetical protein L195_g034504 [Trifolium pratense]
MHRDLEFNQLSGQLPPELGNLHQLENLKLVLPPPMAHGAPVLAHEAQVAASAAGIGACRQEEEKLGFCDWFFTNINLGSKGDSFEYTLGLG